MVIQMVCNLGGKYLLNISAMFTDQFAQGWCTKLVHNISNASSIIPFNILGVCFH